MSLTGKVAIVTGAARGIGAGIALRLAQEGARVAITYATPSSGPKAVALVSRISELGSSAIAILADLANATAPGEIVGKTLSGFGVDHIDILVNNAGVADVHPVEEVTRDMYDHVFDINTRPVFFMTQAVLPNISKGGRIIHVSSTNARTGMPGTAVYAASKVAVEAFTRVMAAEFGPKYGVTVTAVNPGPVATDMYLSAPDSLRDAMHEMVKNVPAGGRMGTPEDIADIVAFLASEKSRWVSGNVVTANGGMVMM
ncbi:putative oxidoreductase [Scedosporium apiospermum]|uniref:Putative oxidoreductase n=1 Tax=Pseudallescheria apiosperma TaxID=563466 RepID=A0A084G9N1_PSEDA|nr:putative oxidoreductase [Scedosporium apiospermum]KEZ44043.1 putative oxidoreductase [Scedosporium apiospermum]